ncbi:MAG: hypothetical protein M1279_02865 [Candidatus Marsarchaeota archaeon]|jgi:hypothetical protein|nr:hypothetical protein [Candidatus Marsarchaeota archaeon]
MVNAEKDRRESNFERRVSEILDTLGIGYEREVIVFSYILYGKAITFTPDFLIKDAKVNGKVVLLEPHGKAFFDDKFIKKLTLFKESDVSKAYYLILITDKDKGSLTRRLNNFNGGQVKLRDICDELIVEKKAKVALESLLERVRISYELLRRLDPYMVYSTIGTTKYSENGLISRLVEVAEPERAGRYHRIARR